MEESLVFTGVLCEKCMNGVMKTMPEEILEDGTVVHRSKCNVCEYLESFVSKPRQCTRKTGISRCGKCGYKYYYNRLESNIEELFELWEQYLICPNCNIYGYQERLIESYGPLKHEHGKYKSHPITQKHRQT